MQIDLKKWINEVIQCFCKQLVYTEVNGAGVTLAAHGSTSVNITIPAKAGYKILCVLNPRTNGAVMPSYIDSFSGSGADSSTAKVWVRNASTGSQTASSVSVGVIYMREELFALGGGTA